MTSKNDVLLDFLTYFSSVVRQWRATLPTPPLLLGFTALQTIRGWEKSSWAMVCNPAWHQSEYWSVSGPGLWRVQGGGGFVMAWSLALSKWTVGAARSGQVSETSRLYSAVTHHTRYTLQIPGSSYLDHVSLSLLIRKWGPSVPFSICEAHCGARLI